MSDLLKFYKPTGPERIGFVLKDGQIVECENVAAAPEDGFEFKPEDLIKYEKQVASSWHTHPGMSGNLSSDDYEGFLNWPDWKHIIIGNDGVSEYKVRGRSIVKDG